VSKRIFTETLEPNGCVPSEMQDHDKSRVEILKNNLRYQRYVADNNYLRILLNMGDKILSTSHKRITYSHFKLAIKTEVSCKSKMKFGNGMELRRRKIHKQVLLYIS
jgi:hypothetical protein